MIPYTVLRRADTGVNNVTLGVWLFIASEVMLFGALFSAYALLRVSSVDWPSGREVLSFALGVTNTLVLIQVTALAWRARTASPLAIRRLLLISSVFGLAFLGLKTAEWVREISAGLAPATNTFLAMYFTLTGLHALHVVAGIAANLWASASARRIDPGQLAGRARSIALYWLLVDLVWFVIFALMYLS